MRNFFLARLPHILLLAAFFLPDYPSAKKLIESQPNIDGRRYKSVMYSTTDSAAKVIDFYKENLKDDFAILYEKMDKEQGGVLFADKTKEGIYLNLFCVYSPVQNSTIIQVSYNLDPFLPASDADAETEVAGKDIPWVKRYPGSIRISFYEDEAGNYRVVYRASTDCLKCVIDHYRQELMSWGWQYKGERKTTIRPAASVNNLSTQTREKLKEMMPDLSIIEKEPSQAQEVNLLFFNKEDVNLTAAINQQDKYVYTTIFYAKARNP
ncbi:MAG: hypothetical protein NC914_00025 [Candidatus Omnitrophica bacterium]|nr:hypothetical protein [Candidatus Omnitrophota bacterium]